MKWKTTLILLIAAIGIGAYISLYEIRQPLPEEREHRAKQLVDIKPESVTQLVLDLPQTKVTLTRDGSTWTLSPNHVRADSDLVSRILNELSPLVAERVLSATPEHPLDPKGYGLEPAIGWLSLVSDTVPTTLFIGESTPVHNNRYMKVANRPEIFVVSSHLFDAANVPVETFRDPLLIHIDPWAIDELRIASPAHTCSLARRENNWHLTQPLDDRADRAQVNALLNRLGGIRIARFVDDAPAVERMAEWGFDKPKAEVVLRGRGAPEPVTLVVGQALADDASLVYAKRSDEPPLYAIAGAEVEALLTNPKTLRSTACFEFFTNNVTKIEWAQPEAKRTIERTGGEWREGGAATALDAQRVDELLNALADMRLIDFVDPPTFTGGGVEDAPSDLRRYGLEPPRGTISVWTTDHDQPQQLSIGSTVEGSQERYGRLEGRSAIVKLPPLVTELLTTAIDQLRPSPATADATSPPPPPAEH